MKGLENRGRKVQYLQFPCSGCRDQSTASHQSYQEKPLLHAVNGGYDGGTSHQHPSSKASGSGIRANPHIMDPNATSCREVRAGRPEKRRGPISPR